MTRWFRWYEGTTEDGKFRLVARKSRVTIRDALAVWAVVLEDAADLAHPGICTKGFDLIDSVLDMEEGQAAAIVQPMIELGMVSGQNGALTILNWHKRQFKSDVDQTAAERKRRQRDRDKGADHAPVTRDIRDGHAALDTDSDSEQKESDATASEQPREAKRERSKPRKRIPATWEPNESHHRLADELGVECASAAVEFLEYWLGEGGLKADWDITFTRRLRAIAERNHGSGRRPGGHSERSPGLAAIAHEVLLQKRA